MISLKDIKDDLSSDIIIEGVTCDSRKVKPGYIFVAIQGEINRGEDFIDEAIKKAVVGDMSSFNKLLEILKKPYKNIDGLEEFMQPPSPNFE